MDTKGVSADPVRRHYNQWVSNEMLEDCALRFTSLKSRRWSCFQVANTALGAISFLALEAIGAAITLQYGPVNALYAIGVVSVVIFLLGIPIALHAARSGVDIDLLTRGAGFGYLGSTITSLIYAGFTFIYFALEAAIMATALQVCFGIPLSLGYLLCSLVVIPVVVYGITMISRLQRYTQHIWILMQLAPFVFLAWQSISPMEGWQGIGLPEFKDVQPFDWLMFGAASAVVFSLVVQIGEQVDYLRFLPVKSTENRTQWWLALVAAGPGWIIIGCLKMLAGVYLCLLAIEQGMLYSQAVDPVHLYLNVWANWVTPELALAITGIFVIICQLKINITNSYAGSIAWSNFFSRLSHSHPGRVVWLVFNVTIAWMLMELGVYTSLENTLSLYSILGVSWIGAIAADLAFNKTLGYSPPGIQFKRAQLYDINPVGVGSMALASAAGLIAFSGVWGDFFKSMATYVALVCVLILVPSLAWFTRGRYYVANVNNSVTRHPEDHSQQTCCICRNDYDHEDLAHCPAYQGVICSLCCSLDTRCENQCRPHAPFLAQLGQWAHSMTPKGGASHTQWFVIQFCALLALAAAMMAFSFGLVYLQSDITGHNGLADFSGFLQKLFAALLVLAAIVVWMFLLTSESARRARQDTVRQNLLLQKEIDAHELTELALNKARQKAEAANEAKSRYVIGLSHELRTPLNSILGYAQLMEQDTGLPRHRQNGVRVIRDSARHLSGLIETLLDISRIEANRLTIHRDRLDLHEFLHQLAQMFRIQAKSANLEFHVATSSRVPARVFADEKRLRQIMINLLSNAFKYTEQGHVELRVDYRSQVTTFKVCDTGVGIGSEDLEQIYQPFETLGHANTSIVKGTGLGLTISKLLAEIMGGDLAVSSVVGKGSCFTLKLLLPPIIEDVSTIRPVSKDHKVLRKDVSVFVVDDDENHRSLLTEFLEPMGFGVHGFANAASCLDALERFTADVFLLDISMPGMNGWELANELRKRCMAPVRILMVSALIDEDVQRHAHDRSSKNYLSKPLDLNRLLHRLDEILMLHWQEPLSTDVAVQASPDSRVIDTGPAISIEHEKTCGALLPDDILDKLARLYVIGHVTALTELLEQISVEFASSEHFSGTALQLLERHELEALGALLESERMRTS